MDEAGVPRPWPVCVGGTGSSLPAYAPGLTNARSVVMSSSCPLLGHPSHPHWAVLLGDSLQWWTCSCPLHKGLGGLRGFCALRLWCTSQNQTCNLRCFSWIEKTPSLLSVHHHVHFKPLSSLSSPSSLPVRAAPLQLTAWDGPSDQLPVKLSLPKAVLNGVAFVPPSCRILQDLQQVLFLQTPSCQSPIWSDHLVCFWIEHLSHNISVYFNNCIPCIGNEPRWSKAGRAKHVVVVIAFALPISNFTV